MVRHTAETYLAAAKEHAETARVLHHEHGDYGAAHYWAGVAVECTLRAYRLRIIVAFDGRHDLLQLAREARFLNGVGSDLAASLSAALSEVAMRWSNDHRYRPGRMVERWLRDNGLDRSVSGDKLKYSSTRIIDAAQTIVQMGARRWPSTTK